MEIAIWASIIGNAGALVFCIYGMYQHNKSYHAPRPEPVVPQIIVKSVGRAYSVVATDGEFAYDGADGRECRLVLEGLKEDTRGKQWVFCEDGVLRGTL